MHGDVKRLLMVDRSASEFAGLRSASFRERPDKANNQRTKPCDAPRSSLSLSPAAERLRSTSQMQRTRRWCFGLHSRISGAGSLIWNVRRRAHAGRYEQEATERTEETDPDSILCFLHFLLFDWQPVYFLAGDAGDPEAFLSVPIRAIRGYLLSAVAGPAVTAGLPAVWPESF